jgi:hypothetical protein
MKGIHQVLVYSDGNSLEKNINAIQKNKETLLDTSKRVVDTQAGRNLTILSRHQNISHNQCIIRNNKFFENVAKSIYL